MRTSDFDYQLPPELIAQYPLAERGASRMLHVDAPGQALRDFTFSQLPELVSEGDVVVLNDTRVIKARLFGQKASGGRVEILIERVLSDTEVLAHVRASKSPKAGSRIVVAQDTQLEVLGREQDLFHLRLASAANVWNLLEEHGSVPLPPYIAREDEDSDQSRYQTVFARERGAVAAPTAGLHFDAAMLVALQARGVALAYVTLHVGAGTFQPVRAEKVSEHVMHAERYEVPAQTVAAIAAARERGARVLAVGTTVARALESAALDGELLAMRGETRLFITPGFRFRVVDRLLTNFHLPRSTLLMLVCAFGGTAFMLRAYEHAVRERYRLFSYGDCMLTERCA